MWEHLWAPSIAKKQAILLLLVISGAFIALYSFYGYEQRAAIQDALIELTRDQLDFVERIPMMAELTIRGSSEQQIALQRRIGRFERLVATLEDGREAEPGRLPFPPIDGQRRERLLAMKAAWPAVREALLAIVSGSPSEQAAAYDELRAAHRQLDDRSEDLLHAQIALQADLRTEVLNTLVLVALVDALLLLAALGLAHRFIGRPVRLIEEATHRIAEGDFGIQVPVVTNDELASLARSFNAMSTKLARLMEVDKQMVHSQKMEAVGQLASGAAHDFNNLLLGVIGHAEFAADQIPRGSPAHEDLRQILTLAQRGADLNRQLLVFSRRQPITRKPIDMNHALGRAVETLRRTLGEDVTLTFTPGPVTHLASVDVTQLDQVVTNLAINARDAMPHGGAVTIETSEVQVSAKRSNVPRFVKPGNYVALVVRDSGVGMDAETLSHVFEPFFTTKEVGMGTGLGLASVYAIVKQHDGYVWIDSEVGRGTTATTYWPSLVATARAEVSDPETTVQRGHERILVVEDQTSVRAVITRLLDRLGYRVTAVDSAAQAELHIARHGYDFDLLLTDVVMPGTSGPELYRRLVERYPGLKVLYVSGAVDRATRGDCPTDRLLMKPFTASELSSAIRATLGTPTLAMAT